MDWDLTLQVLLTFIAIAALIGVIFVYVVVVVRLFDMLEKVLPEFWAGVATTVITITGMALIAGLTSGIMK